MQSRILLPYLYRDEYMTNLNGLRLLHDSVVSLLISTSKYSVLISYQNNFLV